MTLGAIPRPGPTVLSCVKTTWQLPRGLSHVQPHPKGLRGCSCRSRRRRPDCRTAITPHRRLRQDSDVQTFQASKSFVARFSDDGSPRYDLWRRAHRLRRQRPRPQRSLYQCRGRSGRRRRLRGTTNWDGRGQVLLRRYTGDGTPDAAFAAECAVYPEARPYFVGNASVAVQGDRKLICSYNLGHSFDTGTGPALVVRRYQPDGVPDSTLGRSTSAASPSASPPTALMRLAPARAAPPRRAHSEPRTAGDSAGVEGGENPLDCVAGFHRGHAHGTGLRKAQLVHPRDEPPKVLPLAQDLATDVAALLRGENVASIPSPYRGRRRRKRGRWVRSLKTDAIKIAGRVIGVTYRTPRGFRTAAASTRHLPYDPVFVGDGGMTTTNSPLASREPSPVAR
jgi:hypothetical protein